MALLLTLSITGKLEIGMAFTEICSSSQYEIKVNRKDWHIFGEAGSEERIARNNLNQTFLVMIKLKLN